MKKLSAHEPLALSPWQLVSVMVEASQEIRIDCGLVWITIEGDANDYWLAAGATLELVPGRHIVIEADRFFSRIELLSHAMQRNGGAEALPINAVGETA